LPLKGNRKNQYNKKLTMIPLHTVERGLGHQTDVLVGEESEVSRVVVQCHFEIFKIELNIFSFGQLRYTPTKQNKKRA
jgi:hypothetical protein